MSLLNDDSRCADTACPESHTCLRYLQRFTGGPNTPVMATMRDAAGDCESKVDVPAEVSGE